MTVEDIARAALAHGAANARRQDFEPGEAKALAVDVGEHVAAAFVVRRRRDDLWITDVVCFARIDGRWEWRSEGGATWHDLPLARDLPADDALDVFGVTGADDGVHQYVAAAGFGRPGVDAVEMHLDGETRRTGVNAANGAFVAAVRVAVDADIDELDVRALGHAGAEVDSLARQRRDRREAAATSHLRVEDALSLPAGSVASVTGWLLVLEGEPVRLCDEIDSTALPPVPAGATLVIDAPGIDLLPKSWTPERASTRLEKVVITGTVADGALHPTPVNAPPG